MSQSLDIESLNKAFDHRIRLGIMSVLMVNDELTFNHLKELLKITDGNLASHIKSLEDAGYITVYKGFIGRKSSTSYSVTPKGRVAFRQHLDALEKLIKGVE